MRTWRLIPALEQKEWLVERVQTPLGRVLLLVVFLASLAVHVRGVLLLDTAVVLAAITFLPAHRRRILVFAAVYWSVVHVPLRWDLLAGLAQPGGHRFELGDSGVFRAQIAAAVFITCLLLHAALRRRPKQVLTLYPAALLIAVYAGLLFALSLVPTAGMVRVYGWAYALILGQYLWFLAYALMDLRNAPQRELTPQLGLFHPFWGSTNTPFPKGVAYVEQIEAREPGALAVSQLKGLKLLWWSIVLLGVGKLVSALFYGSPTWLAALLPATLPVPPLALAFRASAAGHPLPWNVNFAAMMLDLAVDGLKLAVWGHQFIAVARLAGFNARRNSYKPFLATNVSEFFNRYYYYFKELLVDCFFFPVIYSIPRRRMKLALLAATVSAAGFGNYIYHFFRDVQYVAQRGLGRALIDSHVLLAYTLILSLGIFASQARRFGKSKRSLGRVATLRGMLAVWIFFAVLNSLIVDLWHSDLSQHLVFLRHLLPGAGG